MPNQPIKLTLSQLDIASYHAQYREYLAQDIHSQLEFITSIVTGKTGNQNIKHSVKEIL